MKFKTTRECILEEDQIFLMKSAYEKKHKRPEVNCQFIGNVEHIIISSHSTRN